MSGIISVTGDEEGPPAKSGIPLSDLAAGITGEILYVDSGFSHVVAGLGGEATSSPG